MNGSSKILLTGGTGLLGREVSNLLRDSSELHLLMRGKGAAPERSNTVCHQLDFSEDWKADSLPSKIDAVIHLAQSEHFREFPSKATNIFRVNVESTARLLDYAYRAGARHFVYASSGGVYGYGHQAFKENAPVVDCGKLGYYLSSKYSSELLVQQYSSLMQVTILRFFFIYGKGQRRSMLLPRLIDGIRSGDPVKLEDRNGIRINPIHVADASKALTASLGVDGNQTFNIAGTEEMSLFEICETMSECLGVPASYLRSDAEPNDLIGDVSAMKSKLHVPKIPFRQGIKDLIT
ncbi:MAG: NAD(P)-dependent oxidoreductase [Opitutae bacterium]|jgi:UDP-glucose 4-epimerase|nr:NAD(P)-dependent oxidoreductase [Opitutae bacterium]MBT6851572.1 NAD(P)-dependent oxidoreductase [Opitutae bacterium]